MKRIHYVLLGLLVSLTIAAVSPSLPPTRIAPGANTTVVTNGVNSFTISSSAAGSGAQLDGTNVFTGTNTFSVRPVIPGYRRILYQSPTNSFLQSVAVIPVSVPTNSGDFALVTPIFEITLPPLLSDKSVIHLVAIPNIRTNVNSVAGNLVFYVGTNTNCIALFVGNLATSIGKSRSASDTLIMANGSSTEQHINLAGTGTVIATAYPSNYCGDTSQPWKFYVGAYCTAAYTNINYPTIILEESNP